MAADQNLLVRVASDISNLTTGLNTASRQVSGFVNDTQQKFKAIGDLGQKLTGLGVGLVAGLGGLAVAAGAVEDSTARIQASLGITKAEAENLGAVARSVWKEGFGASAEEASAAVIAIRQNLGDLSNKELKDVTKGAMLLSDLFGADVTESSRTASVMMKNFGITGTEAFDLMTVGFQKGGNFSDELLDTMREYSPAFSTMGHSADEMLNILIAGTEAGAWNLDKVGDAMKEFNIRAKDGSKTTADGFKAIGLDAEQMGAAIAEGGDKGKNAFNATIAALAAMKDPVERNAAGVALFGTQWEDLETDVVTAMATTENKIGEVEGATKRAADTVSQSLGKQFSKALRTIGDAFIPLGQAVLPIVKSIAGGLKTMGEAFASIPAPVQTTIAGIAMLVAGLLLIGGPILFLIGSIPTLVAGFTTFMGAVSSLGAVFTFLTGPVGIVIALIAGLIAGIVWAYNQFDWFRDGVNSIWAQVTEYFNEALTFIKGVVETVMTAVTGFLGAKLDEIQAFWNENGERIMTHVKTAFEFIKSNILAAMEFIKGIFQVVWPIISGIVSVAWDVIKLAINNAIDLIKGIIKVGLDLIDGNWSGAWETIQGTAEDIMGNIVSFFDNIDLWEIGKNIIQGLIDGIGSMGGAIKRKVESMASLIPQWAKDILGVKSPSRVMMEIGEFTGEGFVNGIKSMISDVKGVSFDMASAAIPEGPALSLAYDTPRVAGHAVSMSERSLASGASSGSSQKTTIEIPLYLNGSEIARATYDDINQLMAGDFSMRARMGGLRR